jgi:hypothetical protein
MAKATKTPKKARVVKSPIPPTFQGRAAKLTPTDLRNEAKALAVELAIIHAFSDIESGVLGGFLKTGEPVILFEAKYFHNLTGGIHDRAHPNISSPVWDRTLYGAGGVHQYRRLREAMFCDRNAALQSCSIGRYQVMGGNYRMLGYTTVDDMWYDFCDSEVAHLHGFSAYCKKANLVRKMQRQPPDFVGLAVGYNGPGERANHYDEKLRSRYNYYKSQGEGVVPKLHRMFAGRSHVENPELTIGQPFV